MAHSVLIIESDTVFSSQVSALVAAAGLEVSCARAGLEGLKVAMRRRPKILVINVTLPDIDGLTVLRELRKADVLEGTGIIVLSDYNELGYLGLALACGVAEYWLKSRITPAGLSQRIRDISSNF